jgi:hypothetical protein
MTLLIYITFVAIDILLYLKCCFFFLFFLLAVYIIYIVELRWLKLEGTVKMCSSYRKFEPPNFLNFREKKIWVSLRYYKLMHSTVGLCPKKYLTLLKVLKDCGFWMPLLDIFKHSLETFFSLCSWSILDTGSTNLGINNWIDIGIMFDNSNMYF